VAAALEELSRTECLELLTSRSLGRLAISVDALPAILPVNYALVDGSIVFRTSPGTKLTAALQAAVVAFEIDEADEASTWGWSVLVVGTAAEILDEASLVRMRQLPLRRWDPRDDDHFVRIPLEIVSGRRITDSPASA
jgi:nitroimidazol reductase NimA-like FMN-containing flavoprotein (pyridoxamine 5'-phosphate oxidase superfamily)